MDVVYDTDGNILVEATLTNDLYIFDIRDTMRHQLASSAPKDDLNLWHRRLGHRNKRDILTAVNKDLIMGISKTAVAKDKPAQISFSVMTVQDFSLNYYVVNISSKLI